MMDGLIVAVIDDDEAVLELIAYDAGSLRL